MRIMSWIHGRKHQTKMIISRRERIYQEIWQKVLFPAKIDRRQLDEYMELIGSQLKNLLKNPDYSYIYGKQVVINTGLIDRSGKDILILFNKKFGMYKLTGIISDDDIAKENKPNPITEYDSIYIRRLESVMPYLDMLRKDVNQFDHVMHLIYSDVFRSNDIKERKLFDHVMVEKMLEINSWHELEDITMIELYMIVCDILSRYIEENSRYYAERYENYKKARKIAEEYSNRLSRKINLHKQNKVF